MENYNLDSNPISCITNEFRPYFIIPTEDECKKQIFESCDYTGFFVSYMDNMAQRFNFTYNVTVDTDWGVVPQTGSAENGTWSGVMGGVVNKGFDFR